MNKKELLKEAQALQKEIVAWRRYLHAHAETGFDLSQTAAFVEGKLREFGYTPERYGKSGLVATMSAMNGKSFLLRADMDALPIEERSGEPFACKTGNMHACGHDMHTAMLLGAAKLLKNHEADMQGNVKLLFQPAEELLEGAKNAVEKGVLQNPQVEGAMMMHVMTDVDLPAGTAVVASKGVSAPAADYFRIEIQGKSCHGSAPWNGVDALTAAAHTVIALQELAAREIPISDPAVLTVGSLQAGKAGNVIADSAVLQGTLRAFDENLRLQIKKRLKEISQKIAGAFRAKAKVTFQGGCPTLVNDGELSGFAEKVARSLLGERAVFTSAELSGGGTARKSGGSEDFAYISHEVPSAMIALAAGQTGKGYAYPLHHAKVRFDESVLCVGAALYAGIALEWRGVSMLKAKR